MQIRIPLTKTHLAKLETLPEQRRAKCSVGVAMRRALFNLASMLSLLLSTGSLAMWVRSHYVDEAWVFEPRTIVGPPRVTVVGLVPWELHSTVGSAEGRLVWVAHEEPK